MYVDIRIPKSQDIVTIIISDDIAMRYTDIAGMLRNVADDLEKQDSDKQDSTKQEDTVVETKEVEEKTESEEMGQPETGSLLTKPCGAV